MLTHAAATDVDSKGWAPLRYAAVEGRLDLAEELLTRGADVEGKLGKCTASDMALNGYDAMNTLWAALFYDGLLGPTLAGEKIGEDYLIGGMMPVTVMIAEAEPEMAPPLWWA